MPQRWRSHRGSIRHIRKPYATRKLCFIEPELLPMDVLHCGLGIFDFSAHVTLNFTQWPSYTNSPVFPGDIPGMQIWTSCDRAFESYRLTDRQTDRQTDRHDRNFMRRRFAGGQLCVMLCIRVSCYHNGIIKTNTSNGVASSVSSL